MLNTWLFLIVAISLPEQEAFSIMLILMLQLLIFMAIVLAHFSGNLTLYKKNVPNTLIFAITT